VPSWLPVDPLVPELLGHLREGRNVVLEAPPGAGKTTRIPPALLAIAGGQVLVLEPRRLAARLAARRVASELHEPLGGTVGYQVRFDEVAGPRTRLRFLTEGILTRRLLADRELAGVSVVVLDEFHERHLDGDLSLALLRRMQLTSRPDLRLLVMSATIDTAPVARYLGDCVVLRSQGRLLPLSIDYSPSSPDPLPAQVAAALERLLRDGLDGDVLVFLPGAAEIRQAMRTCLPVAGKHGFDVLPLYGDLTPAEQDRAVTVSERRKVIVSTNVAESSITIEGVTAVIDSGLARVAGFSAWSGLPTLSVARVSKASANQRAGRAGRTRPGRVIRLYPEADFQRRAAQDLPEIARRELSETCLQVRAMGFDAAELNWFEAPPAAALEAARELLERLCALDAAGGLTSAGGRMARYPLHPRLARLIVEAGERGAGDDGCAVAALLSAGQRNTGDPRHAGPSDLIAVLESEWEPNARRIYNQLRRVERLRGGARAADEPLLKSVLAAFPDRVARRRQGDELLLASGGSAVLAASSVVRAEEWLVAVDVEERRERGLPLVRLASAIRPEWLLDLFPERVREKSAVEWNRKAERVEASSALLFEGLILEESRSAAPDPEAAQSLLAEKALEAGITRFADPEEFLARVSFAAGHSALPTLDEENVRAAVMSLCQGRRSFAELERAAAGGGLEHALLELLPAGGGRLLAEVAPERIRLPGGRQVRVRYARNQTPWVASRLQDFFGMKDTPRVARGTVPVVVHLLAPNQRPVQTTTDLAGFWERLYPQVRRELSRRYPRHAWPERPV
jgi:ATP-dependent helicase HrpB